MIKKSNVLSDSYCLFHARSMGSIVAMSSKFTEIKDIEEIAQQADLGADVSEHFIGHFQANQQINITFPLELLQSIDAEWQLQKISRQDWTKVFVLKKFVRFNPEKPQRLLIPAQSNKVCNQNSGIRH